MQRFWIIFCTIAGAAIGAGLLGGIFNSWTLAVVGAAVGAPLGWAFGRFVPLLDAITDLF